MPRAINTFVFKTVFLAGQISAVYTRKCVFMQSASRQRIQYLSIYLSIYLSPVYRSEVHDRPSRMVFMLSVLALLTVSSVSKGSGSSTSAFTALSEAQIYGVSFFSFFLLFFTFTASALQERIYYMHTILCFYTQVHHVCDVFLYRAYSNHTYNTQG